jgi:hypothetical protein
MGLTKKIYSCVFALLILGSRAVAQSIEMGAGMNYLSNGLSLTCQLPATSRWEVGGGLRVMVNTYALNKSRENRAYYQNGYASKIWEHFGLSGRVRYRIFQGAKFGVDAFGNLLITWHGLKRNTYDVPDITTGQYNDDIIYAKPGLALEAVVGPNLHYDISKRIRLNAAAGMGVVVTNYSREKQSLITGKPVLEHRATNYQGRWDIGFVGLDGLPMIYIGVAYKLK